ncbi:MAG: 4Fe-4S binding protein [Firmicutes bacterium]|nr:4Fe-4S binding protein [Bacillota bacterium]
MPEKAKRDKSRLTIDQAWCKGCGICVEFCPKNVLTLEGGKIKINSIADCIACGMCESLCPDYAIWFKEA